MRKQAQAVVTVGKQRALRRAHRVYSVTERERWEQTRESWNARASKSAREQECTPYFLGMCV